RPYRCFFLVGIGRVYGVYILLSYSPVNPPLQMLFLVGIGRVYGVYLLLSYSPVNPPLQMLFSGGDRAGLWGLFVTTI
ncbi:hypothetical protein B9T07_15320, partial [Limnospira fusiformis CCALA 023]